MRKFYIILLLGVLLAACASGKTTSPASQPVVPGMGGVSETSETPAATQMSLPTQTSLPTQPPLTVSTPTSVSKTISEAMPGCTAKSLFPTPDATAEALFPAISESDWVRGPSTASVTLIEYSDFQ